MASRPWGTSGRLRVVALALVALVGVALVMTLQAVRISADRGDSVNELLDLRAQMYALSQLEWQGVYAGDVAGDLVVEVGARRASVNRLLDRVGQRQGNRPATVRVQAAAARYLLAYDEEIRLLRASDIAAAVRVDDGRVDPAFDRLAAAVDDAVTAGQGSADLWLRIVSFVVAAIVPCMALFALWWLRRESRREAAIEVERTARASARRFESMVRGASDLVLVTGSRGEVTYASPAAHRMLGCDAADLHGAGLRERIHVDDLTLLRDSFLDVRASGPGETSVELRAMHVDGSWRTLECRLRNAANDVGMSGVVWNVRDVTERRVLEGQLSHQACHDSLTGLANRALLTDRLAQALPRAARVGAGVGVVVVDLDAFKDVNDSLGHEAGDDVIVAVAARLRRAVRLGDTVARIGGDEFVLLLDGLVEEEAASAVAARAVELLSEPMRAGGRPVVLTASAGLACAFGADLLAPRAAAALVRDADLAMYAAKARGKSQAIAFDGSMRAQVQDRLDLIVDIRSAASRGEIRPLYQPLVDLQTQTVVGFEALARWHHPTRGVLLPLVFIPLAEETGTILEIGSYMLRAACTQVAWWNGTSVGAQPLEISVNLSARQLAAASLVPEVEQVLTETGLRPELLVLEVTESAVVEDIALAITRLRELRTLGVRIAMDDFGTGYSSLSYLRRLPIDILKIDKSFLDDQSGRGAKLLAGVAALGATLGLTTIAEGIEAPAQLAQVQAAGCTMGQGFHFARPLAPDAAGSFVRDQTDRFASLMAGSGVGRD
jgi:diguanylate cyclase (GGDEF)-like protein/PAS domain S-box-containing protein